MKIFEAVYTTVDDGEQKYDFSSTGKSGNKG
jgi:hypothetical protein